MSLQGEGGGGESGETALWLVSVGLEWLIPDQSGDEYSHSIPDLVERIVARVSEVLVGEEGDAAVSGLLQHIRDYGGQGDLGYDHLTMKDSPAFRQPFAVHFVRSYDMGDPAVQVLRSDDEGNVPTPRLIQSVFASTFPSRSRVT